MSAPNKTEQSSPAVQDSPTEPMASASFSNRSPWRVWTVIGILALLATILVLRLFDMQVRSWQLYAPLRQKSSSGTVDDTTQRGVIVDRDGVLLAADRFIYRVTATPKYIPEANWQKLAGLLEEIAGIPKADTLTALAENPDGNYAVLAAHIPRQQGKRLLAEKKARRDQEDYILEYVYATALPQRFYPQNRLASQTLGFLNAERTAVLGLERYYDRFLRDDGVGLPRGRWTTRDALPEETLRFIPPGKGKGLVLTLDRTIQWIIEDELREGVRFYGAESGSIIVMDPRTGAILGMANTPSFDPNHYEEENSNYFSNPAVSAQYEPGSIFKIITMAAALDTNTVEPTTIFTDTGTIVVGQRTIENSSRTAAGQVTVADALALSLNVVTVQVAEALGSERFYNYVARFGFGEATEIDLAGEIAGLVKSPGNPAWSWSDLGTNSFGQGLAVTPIQMITAAAAIANQGRLMQPYVVQARIDDDRVLVTSPTVVRQSISPETAATLTEMMVHTVEVGNKAARVPGYTVAGKSGTAEIATAGGYNQDKTIASFVGFVPADDPQFVVLVRLNRPDPDISRWAAYTAAPLFSRVAHRLLDHLNIPPDDVRLAKASQ